jgi:hypothetical protein
MPPLVEPPTVKLPSVRGVIDRRILVNYRVDPEALDAVLPDRFEPKLVDGHGVGGICLIRLRDVRPPGLPAFVGPGSENAAHRIAVEWDEEGTAAADGGDEAGSERRSGVYVPRRDTSSRLNVLLGGRLFSSAQHHATFEVAESDGRYRVRMESTDGEAAVAVDGRTTDALPDDSVFDAVEDSSTFFREGSLGYSPRRDGGYDGVELHTHEWSVTPLAVDSVRSSYFEGARFPDDAVAFDHALLMADIDHEWRQREPLCAP